MRQTQLRPEIGRLPSWLKSSLALGTGMAILIPGIALAGAFQPTHRGAPASTTDGGTRGSIQFSPTHRGAPSRTTDGGTRGSIEFSPTHRGAPSRTTDGGTREGGTASLPRRGAPDNTTEGGTRAPQMEVDTVALLVPETALPLTVDSHPEFFAYIPDGVDGVVKFTLYRHDRNTGADTALIYEVELTAPATAGIMKFELPPDERYALQPGELYHWYVSLVAGTDGDASSNLALDSWVERLTADDAIAQRLAQLNPQADTNIYATAGIWQDALSYAVAQRDTDMVTTPQACAAHPELTDVWGSLLQSVDLCGVVSAPIVE